MSAGGTEQEFWIETERWDAMMHPERAVERTCLDWRPANLQWRHTSLLLFSEHEGKVSTGSSAGALDALEGLSGGSWLQLNLGLDSTGVETCLHTCVTSKTTSPCI